MNKNYNFFMSANMSSYVGKWVAIDNNNVIAVADDPAIVIKKAKELSPKKRPFIAKVPEKAAMIF